MPNYDTRPRTKEKEKHCAYCERTFTKEEHLKRHQRTHTGEKPFRCQKCHRKYSRSDVLARHIQTHHPELLRRGRNSFTTRVNAVEPPSKPSGRDNQNTTDIGILSQSQSSAGPSNHPQGITSQGGDKQFAPSSDRFPPPTDYQQSLQGSRVLFGANDCTNLRPAHTRSQHRPPDQEDPVAEVPSSVANTWEQTCREGLNEVAQEQWHSPTSLSANRSESVSNSMSHRERHAVTSPLPRSPTAISQNMMTQIMRDQESLAPQSMNYASKEQDVALSHHHDQQPQPPGFTATSGLSIQPPYKTQQLSHVAGAARHVVDPFMTEVDIDNFDHLSHGLLNDVDFTLPYTPLSLPHLDERADSPKVPFSAEQVQQLRPLWGGKRAAPGSQLIRSLWFTVTRHGADNIFSAPAALTNDRLEEPRECQRWNIDEQGRRNLVEFCEELVDGHNHRDDVAASMAQSTPPESHVTAELPATEVLNASIDFFFQSFHAPFVHKATFDARSTSCSLLLPMCLVGLAGLYPERLNGYVLQYLKRLMVFCHRDLTYKALGGSQPWELLTTIAATLLVVYLALGFLEELDDCQAHILCSQMLHVVEKHGLFAAYDGDNLDSQLQMTPADQDGSWKAWARAESIKRMLNYLVWLDMAYARVVGSVGSVDMGKLDLYLPCEIVLFESPTSTRFFQLAEGGAQLMMPRMQIHSFHTCGPSALDSISMQTFLSALFVQIAALRHKSTVGNSLLPEDPSSPTPGEPGKPSIPENIIPCLLSVPTTYAKIFQGKDVINALAWNNVCVALTADLNLLEVAFGREGLDAARSAMVAVARWSRTAAARRAAVHAAQMFEILSSARLSESNVARPDQMLYVSALVLSMYLFASDPNKRNKPDAPVFELLQDIDWAVINGEGMLSPPEADNEPSADVSPNSQDSQNSTDAARHFIRHGGIVSFAGEAQQGGGSALKRAMLNYVHLLEDIGKYRGSKYTRLLKTMCDLVIEEVK